MTLAELVSINLHEQILHANEGTIHTLIYTRKKDRKKRLEKSQAWLIAYIMSDRQVYRQCKNETLMEETNNFLLIPQET